MLALEKRIDKLVSKLEKNTLSEAERNSFTFVLRSLVQEKERSTDNEYLQSFKK